ncbi:MAG: transcriptional regulator [Ahrensia sp.]|nr:transcriptional regulator [Ahrensia sp.]
MSVKDAAQRQCQRIVDRAGRQLAGLATPSGGWLATARKALGMSGADVARRMGVTRAAIHQAERNEADGAITLRQMEKLAAAIGGKFVYAIVLEDTVEDAIRAQARRKAENRVRRAGVHMALEDQALSLDETARRIDELARQLARDMPPGFWDDQ